MSAVVISLIVFGCVFGGALAGIALRALLPEQHLNADSKGAVTVAMGLVATLSALVLGLLVGSAKAAYDAQSTAMTNMSAQLIMLDRVLSHYGPETRPIRRDLRTAAVNLLERPGRRKSCLRRRTSGGSEALRRYSTRSKRFPPRPTNNARFELRRIA